MLTTITLSGSALYSKDYKMFGKSTDMPHSLESQSGQKTQETKSHGKWCRVIVLAHRTSPLLFGMSVLITASSYLLPSMRFLAHM